jgi:hypothetical protein
MSAIEAGRDKAKLIQVQRLIEVGGGGRLACKDASLVKHVIP